MPPLFSDAVAALLDFYKLVVSWWGQLSLVTRIIAALAASALAVYSATRTEQSGLSMLLFFSAFGFFAYVIAMGFSFLQ
jgi:hypothetical protein